MAMNGFLSTSVQYQILYLILEGYDRQTIGICWMLIELE